MSLFTEISSFSIVTRKADYIFHSATQSICPICKDLINAQRIIKDDKVYMRKFCPRHGYFEVLISSYAPWYLGIFGEKYPDYRPKKFNTEARNGCPYDCGLCPDHQHHTCKAVIEVTDACNLKCPVCLVGEDGKYYLPLDEIKKMTDNFISCEGEGAELITISGGEPTMHPEILKILSYIQDSGIRCIHLNTNGLRVAKDKNFVETLSQFENLYLNLQFDSFSPNIWKITRGVDLSETKIKALENLETYHIKTILTSTVIKGINDHELGDILHLIATKSFIKAFNMQPIVYIGRAVELNYNPCNPTTIPDVILSIEAQTNGLVKMNDWIAPCSPQCVANCYVHIDGDGEIIPVKDKFLGEQEYRGIVHNRSDVTLEITHCCNSKIAEKKVEYMSGDCCGVTGTNKQKDREGEIKKLNIHHFMNAYTFDIERVMECCIHCLVPDNKIIPWCVYNHFYRDKDLRYREKFTLDAYRLSPEK